ncbi:hypothetical protein LTR84_006796 [Exophiala bonariae]|uniref:Xylanolytic transcriptional activator regulatory domain-containing protein n=1 Tax=Exophiala bonariae TaxID=1690606 RepID=A0AAV9MZX9_9EURO|nr:hypothetical protein LTR84_006796 [Exophiala bonariae]
MLGWEREKNAPNTSLIKDDPEEVQMRPADTILLLLPTGCHLLYLPYGPLETRAETWWVERHRWKPIISRLLIGSTHRHARLRSPTQGKPPDEPRSITSPSLALLDRSGRDPTTIASQGDGILASPENLPSEPSSPNKLGSNVGALNLARAISLSRILHPSHEPSPGSRMVQKEPPQPGFLLVLAGAQENLTKACEALRMSILQAQSMFDLFFELVAGLNSLSLFHQPSFPDKVRSIQDHQHLIALFGAMFSLSSRFSADDSFLPGNGSARPSHEELHTISLQYINSSLEACSSNAPPLCLLQAITLAGFYKLVNGVYGPAWRLVGTGVRIAYELRLDLIDSKEYVRVPTCDSELMAWTVDEERRRCWWALWEMDIFCSTIQRTPTAINWSMNETFLPVSDEYWFTNTYQASCLLHGTPEERWKRLKQAGNESSVAWANLFASLMHDGRILCQESMKGIVANADHQNDASKLAQYYSNRYRQKTQESSVRLSELVRAYQQTVKNLPASLSYHGESLSFDVVDGEDPFLVRRTSSAKYSVHMMSASACYMIYQNSVFADVVEGLILMSFSADGHEAFRPDTASNEEPMIRNGFRNYLAASDMVLRLVAHCPEDHARYVNPYYASTIWIAAAILVFKRMALRDNASDLSQRQYDLLRRSYLQFSRTWETPTALLQNLDSLEARLETRQKEFELSETRAWNIDIDDQRSNGEAQSSMTTESTMRPAYQDRPFHDCVGLRDNQGNTSQPPIGDSNESYSTLLVDDVEWLSTTGSVFDPVISQAVFPGQGDITWPNELFMDNLAWYSSDVMAGLVHGYTS